MDWLTNVGLQNPVRAHNRCAGRHIARHNGIGANNSSVPHHHVTNNTATRAENNIVSDMRVESIRLSKVGTDCHVLVDNAPFAKYDAAANYHA